MPRYHIERTTTIESSADHVKAAIENFEIWPRWSPWLCMEPECKLSFEGTPGKPGHAYAWDGKVVGSGRMEIATASAGEQAMLLEFIKPFKSKADVGFKIEATSSEQTNVVWSMDGKMPFFMFFMMETLKSMIGMDYERGLRMLKEYLETGAVKSKSEFAGIVEAPARHFVGVEDECAIQDLGASMQRTIPQAKEIVAQHKLESCGMPGAIYDRYDFKQNRCRYTAICPVSNPVDLPGIKSGTIGGCRALRVKHAGSYEHLGNSWSTAMAQQRHHRLKPLKSQAPFELYLRDPEVTELPEVTAEIFVPVRG